MEPDQSFFEIIFKADEPPARTAVKEISMSITELTLVLLEAPYRHANIRNLRGTENASYL